MNLQEPQSTDRSCNASQALIETISKQTFLVPTVQDIGGLGDSWISYLDTSKKTVRPPFFTFPLPASLSYFLVSLGVECSSSTEWGFFFVLVTFIT